MSETRKSTDGHQPSTIATPGDVPGARPPTLTRLRALLGEWRMEASFDADYFAPGSPPLTAPGGRTVFEWLIGEYFLLQRFTANNPAPSGIAIIGVAPEPETFAQHYYDSRGVTRVYQMSLEERIWKLWREAPGFRQRYAGEFSADGTTIRGAWEGSPDGNHWTHDFTLNYTRIG
jgi:hypothetical protein